MLEMDQAYMFAKRWHEHADRVATDQRVMRDLHLAGKIAPDSAGS